MSTARCFTLFLTLISLVSCGEGVLKREMAEPAANLDAGGAAGSVWVADREGQPGRLFLCGTIHILRESDYPLSPGYEAAYNHATELLLELPPGAGDGTAMATRMRELGTYPSGAGLQASVKPETWQAVLKWGGRQGYSASALDRFRPWFLSLIITSTEYSVLGAKPDIGVDQYFETRATRDGKHAEGLETVELQLQLFSQLTEHQQTNMLEQTLAEVVTLSQEYEKMIDAWKKGELDALHDMLFREAERYPELMDLFLKNRNLAWIDRLDQMLKDGRQVMVLVGTGHLASKEGLLQLLRDRGCRVRHHREVKDL